MKKVAVVNCGSSSIKYEVFGVPDLVMLATGLIEKIGSSEGRLRQRKRKADGTFDEQLHSKGLADHRDGFAFMADVNREDRIIQDEKELAGIGHRVVHGGELFREPTLIDDRVVDAIRGLIPLAPLHNPSNLLGIEVARKGFPDTPQVAVFDTAFHQSLPPHAFQYAVPYDWYATHHVRRVVASLARSLQFRKSRPGFGDTHCRPTAERDLPLRALPIIAVEPRPHP